MRSGRVRCHRDLAAAARSLSCGKRKPAVGVVCDDQHLAAVALELDTLAGTQPGIRAAQIAALGARGIGSSDGARRAAATGQRSAATQIDSAETPRTISPQLPWSRACASVRQRQPLIALEPTAPLTARSGEPEAGQNCLTDPVAMTSSSNSRFAEKAAELCFESPCSEPAPVRTASHGATNPRG